MLLCQLQAPSDQFDIRTASSDSAGRFFLEHVKHVDCALEPHRIGRTIRIAAVVLNNLKDSRSFTLPRFGAWMFAAELSDAEGGANVVLNGLGKGQQIAPAGANPEERRFAGDSPWS